MMKKIDALKEIAAKKQQRLILVKQQVSIEEMMARAQGLPVCRPFLKAINRPREISLIAEIKKQSPSHGLIAQDFNPAEIARVYEQAGVQAVSVLTEEDFFAGNLAYINEVKNATKLAVLRKDFILEPYQIYESRVYGADAVLLIADLLTKERLTELIPLAKNLGMDCLLEAHGAKELKKILNLKNELIGINNRDLHTLEVNLKTTENLFLLIPKDKVVVVESGISSYQDVLFLKILGVKAVLVGEAIMRAEDKKRKIEELMGW